MEVTQYLRQLTQRGEMYKYLNRYIIGFEDKYYAAYSGISDINEAMRIADGGRLTKTEEEKAEEADLEARLSGIMGDGLEIVEE